MFESGTTRHRRLNGSLGRVRRKPILTFVGKSSAKFAERATTYHHIFSGAKGWISEITACSFLMMWADFSAWLVSVGFVIGILAALAGLADFARNRSIRAQTSPWLHALGVLLILIVAFFNMLVHTRDAWTSVVPIGLVLSVITVLILPVTGWLGWSISYRQSVGVVR